MGVRGEQRRRRRRLLLCIAVLTAAVVPLAVAAALAAPSSPIVLNDPAADVSGPLDLRRAAVRRASDGRLRAILTFAGKVTPSMLLASSGPPGSACMRVWTDPNADPSAMRPEHLVCVTARSEDELRAGVFSQRDAGLPRRVASASVKLSASGRSLVIRVSQSSLGRPRLIRFAVESTRPGCERTTCIDTVPDAGAVRRFRFR
jgi:hypothetical protein